MVEAIIIHQLNIYNLLGSFQIMPVLDALQKKERIINFLKYRGPCLPIHIAHEIDTSILFASAFLGELLSEQRVKISCMRVGSSPIYFIPGQEPKLENYSQHLKGREKEAYLLLKEKKFLKDSEQTPVIRVALRAVKDFAIPFKPKNLDEIFWRFFTAHESEFNGPKIEITKETAKELPKENKVEIKPYIEDKNKILVQKQDLDSLMKIEIKEEDTNKKDSENISKDLDTFDSSLKEEKLETSGKEDKKIIRKKSAVKKTKSIKKKSTQKQDNFFNKVKEFLANNSMELIDIEEFRKEEITLKIKNKKQEQLFFAFNKKRIEESDIIKSYKKASEKNMPYSVACLGELPKKLESLIEALKNLDKVERIE
jgi:hypothetical protein